MKLNGPVRVGKKTEATIRDTNRGKRDRRDSKYDEDLDNHWQL